MGTSFGTGLLLNVPLNLALVLIVMTLFGQLESWSRGIYKI